MKKLVYFVICLSLLLLLPNKVYAQSEDIVPQAISPFMSLYMRLLEYEGYEFVQEHDRVYEYIVTYSLPYRYIGNLNVQDYVFTYRWGVTIFQGGLWYDRSSYVLENVILEENRTVFQFRFTMLKEIVNNSYSGILENLFLRDSAIYVKFNYIDPERVMKNFLLAELYQDFSYEETIGLEKYYVYLDAQVYLPNGTKRSITVMPDIIDDNPELFEGYEFIAVSFNLSPRARFWAYQIYPNDPIVGLSYIVYDLVARTTTFYDYQGNAVLQLNSITYLDNPQFSIPEAEAMEHREKRAYEEGKNEGYKQGREEGERAGKRKMQEEMQQVIDNLTEYYENELIRAYNRGKNDGASEQLDVFSYLQALFGEYGLGRLLRLELLPGVSLGAVIMIPLAFWLVSFIMRWFN